MEEKKTASHVVLCHQAPEVVEAIYQWHRGLAQEHDVAIAYGGSRENFDKMKVDRKFFMEDPSLRGPSHRMSHIELLEKAMALVDRPEHTFFSSAKVTSFL